MQVKQHRSSGAGNLYEVVSVNGSRLLLEIGVVWKEIQKSLNFDLSNIEAVFATHFHADHFREPKKAMDAGLDVYASYEAFESKGLLGERRAKVIEDKTLVRLNTFEIFCFSVIHDCPNTLGFIVREKSTNEYLLFCTDTAYIKQRFSYPFSIIMLECSYDKDILQERVDTQTINETLAKRLLTSHMEKQVALRYIDAFCNLSLCHEIHLLHCSGDNLNKEQTRKEFEETFMINTIIAGHG